MALFLAPQVAAELDEIWYYVARESGNPQIADRLIDSITARFFLLSTHPFLGRPRDKELRPGLRSFPVGNYLVIYRVKGEACSSCMWLTETATWHLSLNPKLPNSL